jgi:hypothetical protein
MPHEKIEELWAESERDILILRYSEVLSQFCFYTSASKFPNVKNFVNDLNIEIQGPIGAKNKYIVIKNDPPEYVGPVEIGDTKEEAVKLGYQEALKFKDILQRDIKSLSKNEFKDETGMGSKEPSKLERVVIKG